jgi:hypothetical protein
VSFCKVILIIVAQSFTINQSSSLLSVEEVEAKADRQPDQVERFMWN